MNVKKCSCHAMITTKNCIYVARDENGLWLTCSNCLSTVILRQKRDEKMDQNKLKNIRLRQYSTQLLEAAEDCIHFRKEHKLAKDQDIKRSMTDGYISACKRLESIVNTIKGTENELD